MRRLIGVGTLATILLGSANVSAEEAAPDRLAYVAQVEPICKRNTEANKRILAGARQKVKDGQLAVAGRQFTRAAHAFGRAVRELSIISRPPSDGVRLTQWFSSLGKIKENLWNVGLALRQGNRAKANHEAIRVERSGNAANNVTFAFEFHYCRFKASTFS